MASDVEREGGEGVMWSLFRKRNIAGISLLSFLTSTMLGLVVALVPDLADVSGAMTGDFLTPYMFFGLCYWLASIEAWRALGGTLGWFCSQPLLCRRYFIAATRFSVLGFWSYQLGYVGRNSGSADRFSSRCVADQAPLVVDW